MEVLAVLSHPALIAQPLRLSCSQSSQQLQQPFANESHRKLLRHAAALGAAVAGVVQVGAKLAQDDGEDLGVAVVLVALRLGFPDFNPELRGAGRHAESIDRSVSPPLRHALRLVPQL